MNRMCFLIVNLSPDYNWGNALIDEFEYHSFKAEIYTIILSTLIVPWIPHGFCLPHVTPSLMEKGLVSISEAPPSYEANLGHSLN